MDIAPPKKFKPSGPERAAWQLYHSARPLVNQETVPTSLLKTEVTKPIQSAGYIEAILRAQATVLEAHMKWTCDDEQLCRRVNLT